MPDDLFGKLALCTWSVGGRVIPLSVARIEESGGNRIIERERPMRDGAKLDDTGSKAKRYRLTGSIFNGSTEQGIPEDNYPDTLQALILSFDTHETGDLMVPTRGIRRCRAGTYSTTEGSDARDCAAFVLEFIEDNEDGVTASSFSTPSARSVLRSQVEEATFEAEKAGVQLGDLIGSITEMASEIEGLLNAPADFASQVDSKIKAVDSALSRIEKAGTGLDGGVKGPVSEALIATQSAPVIRKIRGIRDTLSRAVGDQLSAFGKAGSRSYPRTMSIFDVATLEGVNAATLMAMNPAIGAFLAIPPNTPIAVPNG